MGNNKELEESIKEVMGNSKESNEFKRRFANLIKNAIDNNFTDKDIEDLIELARLEEV